MSDPRFAKSKDAKASSTQVLTFARGEKPDLGRIPDAPGVYVFRDGDGRILYVGKARSLRKRVANYFGAPSGLTLRIRTMVTSARTVEWTVVSGEVQALLLEYSLIQENRPRFNVRYRDDKSYPKLAVTVGEKWPKAYVTRAAKRRRGVQWFGPYAHTSAIRETVDALTRVFPMRTCRESLFKECERLNRACLYYHIGRCPGPCIKACTEDEYRANVEGFTKFLEGDADEILEQFEREMLAASDRLEFEAAARRRDQLNAARRALERQEIVASRSADMDVIGVAANEIDYAAHVFHIRGGRVVGRDGSVIELVRDVDDAERLKLWIQDLYTDREAIPPEVVVPYLPADADAIREWLSGIRGSAVKLTVPRSGEKAAALATVTENSRHALVSAVTHRRGDLAERAKALNALQDALDLPESPLRIECFDISTLHGTETVASMVVFEDGMPKPADYRHFNIKTVEGTDDFASMREVIERRFKRLISDEAERDAALEGKRPKRFAYRPQLVLIDGGKGQLSAALDGMRAAGVTDIPVVSIAKRLEEVFVPWQPEPMPIPQGSDALHLLQHLRDEAHRFAITHHRKRRGKAGLKSELDDIPGVGKVRRTQLIRWFGSVEAIRNATLDEIRAVPGVPRSVAETVFEHLNPSV